MQNRFKHLNDNKFSSNTYSKNHKKSHREGRTLDQLSNSLNKRSDDKQKNVFKNPSKHKKKEEIDFSKDLNAFPELVVNKESKVENNNNYIEKVNQEKKEIKKKELPPGWIVLNKLTPKTQKNFEEISPYYNPELANKILLDRMLYREELNELLGDISPYWDPITEGLNTDDDIDDDDDTVEDDEEEDYVEDW
tara:strand:- start:6333 stop:6911 length:579 start_codon:yes stop_codon:yes gene_type:complete